MAVSVNIRITQKEVIVLSKPIGLDYDGVVVDTSLQRAEVCKIIFDVDIDPRHFAAKTVVADGLLTEQQYEDLMWKVFGDPKYATRMTVLPGAIPAIHSLVCLGFLPRIVTMRPDDSLQFVARLLCDNRLQNVELLSTNRNKDKSGHLNGCVAFVDDRVAVLEKLRGTVEHLFLLDTYSVQQTADWYTVCHSWFELRPQLAALA